MSSAMKTPSLLEILQAEKKSCQKGGIYHKVQIELTYNSNHIEGSRLTAEETRYIYETNTIGLSGGTVNVNDIVETANHFQCINLIIDQAEAPLTESLLKKIHAMLKNGTADARLDYFAVGEYKRLPNEVGGKATAAPEDVQQKMGSLLAAYEDGQPKDFNSLLDFHYRFESIHPFQDGNGRVGRLLLFKECLRHDIVPFIIEDDLKLFYYRGLSEWEKEPGFLRDTCLTAQDRFKRYLDYFRISY